MKTHRERQRGLGRSCYVDNKGRREMHLSGYVLAGLKQQDGSRLLWVV